MVQTTRLHSPSRENVSAWGCLARLPVFLSPPGGHSQHVSTRACESCCGLGLGNSLERALLVTQCDAPVNLRSGQRRVVRRASLRTGLGGARSRPFTGGIYTLDI
eukprot:6101727-Amphidinium_carterae.1